MHVLVVDHGRVHELHSGADRRLLINYRVAPAAGYIQNIARPLFTNHGVAGLPAPGPRRLDRVRRRRRRPQVPRLPAESESIYGLLVVVPRPA